MNVDTGKVEIINAEALGKMTRAERSAMVLLPDEPTLIEKAKTMNRKQRRRYKTLVERRGRSAEDALVEVLQLNG